MIDRTKEDITKMADDVLKLNTADKLPKPSELAEPAGSPDCRYFDPGDSETIYCGRPATYIVHSASSTYGMPVCPKHAAIYEGGPFTVKPMANETSERRAGSCRSATERNTR